MRFVYMSRTPVLSFLAAGPRRRRMADMPDTITRGEPMLNFAPAAIALKLRTRGRSVPANARVTCLTR